MVKNKNKNNTNIENKKQLGISNPINKKTVNIETVKDDNIKIPPINKFKQTKTGLQNLNANFYTYTPPCDKNKQ